MLFFAICVGAAFVVQRPLWEKIVMVASAAPIAVMANVARIVLTAVFSSLVSAEAAEEVMHDMAGLLMMPIGLGLLWAEMTLLSKLMVTPLSGKPLVAHRVVAGETVEAAAERGLPRKRLR